MENKRGFNERQVKSIENQNRRRIKQLEIRIKMLEEEMCKLKSIISNAREVKTKEISTQEINDILNELQLDYELAGRKYLAFAIKYCCGRKEKVKMCNELYAITALEYNTSAKSVERAIRYTIERALEKSSPKMIEIFRGKNHLKNSEFIYGVLYYLNQIKG